MSEERKEKTHVHLVDLFKSKFDKGSWNVWKQLIFSKLKHRFFDPFSQIFWLILSSNNNNILTVHTTKVYTRKRIYQKLLYLKIPVSQCLPV